MRFIRAIESVIAIDGEISAIERQQLLSFAQLLR
jgi:tellurite resistance protein